MTGNGKVVIANVHGSSHAPSFTYSILGLKAFDTENRLVDDNGTQGFAAAFAGPEQIPKSRNQLCHRFLELHDAEWLFFLDSDMGVDQTAVEMLIASADPDERPVVGGLCFAQKSVGVGAAHAFRSHFYPTIYTWGEDEHRAGFNTVYDYPRDAIVQTAATGGACLLIHRNALLKVEEKFPGNQWFRRLTYKDIDFSEDMSFSLRLMVCGIPLFVNTAVKTSHAKTVWVDEDLYDLLRRNSKRDVTVIIPVKDQLEMTRSIVRQIEQGGNYERILIFDNGSGPETKEWLAGVGGEGIVSVYDAEGLNIHQMWNHGIEEARAQSPSGDVAILNNDLKLAPDFLAKLQDALHTDPSLMAVSANYDNRDFEGAVQPTTEICAARYDGTGGFAGFAFMIRGDFLDSGYRFPEELHWWYGDNDLLATIQTVGGWAGIAKDARCVHLDGGSVTSRELDQDEFAARCQLDREWFLAKWSGGEPVASDDAELAPGFLDVAGRH